jgi:integrase
LRTLTPLVTERGQLMNVYSLGNRLDTAKQAAGIAKDDLQFRDVRPTAAAEIKERDGTRQAQGLLGHINKDMTTQYIRHKSGKLLRLTK